MIWWPISRSRGRTRDPSSFLLPMLTSVAAYGQVPFERIINAGHEPQNWLTYSGNYAGHRYSELREIDRKSVASLKMAWAIQMPSSRTETTPIAIDGILYITAPNMVSAIDGKTGRSLWTWTRRLSPKFRMNGFVAVNRGAAVLDDTLYVGALDGVLIALDLKSGSERCEHRSQTGMPVSPSPRHRLPPRQGDHRRQRRRSRSARFPRCLRREDRQACLALLYRAGTG